MASLKDEAFDAVREFQNVKIYQETDRDFGETLIRGAGSTPLYSTGNGHSIRYGMAASQSSCARHWR